MPTLASRIARGAFVATLLLLASPAFAIPGDLDPTFGTGGKVFTNISTGGGIFKGVVVQNDRKVLATGSLYDNGVSNVIVARYSQAGVLDATFGTGGLVVTPVGSGDSTSNAIALQLDGKIVVAGTADGAFVLIRYNTDGSLDAGFGTGGLASLQIGDGSEALGLAIQNGGFLVAAGYAFNAISGQTEFAVARFTNIGTLDTGFGCAGPGPCSGFTTTAFGALGDTGRSVMIQNDGRIVVAGSTGNATGADFAVARYNTDGTLDATFGSGGMVTTVIGPGTDFNIGNGVARQPDDGKIVVVGESDGPTYSRMVAIRYEANGTLDATFGTNGIRVVTEASDSSGASAVVVLPDNTIAIAGFGGVGVTFGSAYVRLDANGAAFPGFGTSGVVIGLPNSVAFALARGPVDGRLAMCGRDFSTSPTPLTIERFKVDGTVDTIFNTTGFVEFTGGSSSDTVSSLAIQADGRIVAAGAASIFNSISAGIARYLPDGSLDTSFATAGILTFGGVANRVAIQADGKIVVAYNSTTTFRLRRYNADGTADTTFNGTGLATVNIGTTSHLLNGIAIQPDGRIVVVGAASNGANTDFALARFNTNGTLDTTFNGTGKRLLPIGTGADAASAVSILSNGKILVAGSSVQPGNSNDFVLVRLNADGSTDGTYIDAVLGATIDTSSAMAVQADGRILIGGASGPNSAVIRLNADLTLDTGFATAGAFVTPGLGVRSIALQPDGRIVLATSGSVVHRLSAAGAPDATFGSGGSVNLVASGLASTGALALQADGQIVVAGTGNRDFALMRLDWSTQAHPFTFPTQLGVARSTIVVSAPAQITGIGLSSPISVVNGEYCISAGNSCSCDVRGFSPSASTIANGQYACVRHTSASGFAQSVTTTLTVDTVSGTFTSTTLQVALITIAAPAAFANQAVGTTGAPQSIAISNLGSSPATSMLVLVEGGDFVVVSTTCTSTLAPLATCSANVAFSPVQTGARAGELVVLATDATQARTSVTLTGNGTAQGSLVPTIGTSAATTTYGTTVTFTATVPTATNGIVFFHDGGNFIGADTLTGTTATFATRLLAAGVHSITAEFAGNASYAAGVSAPITQTVNGAGSMTLVQASANPAYLGTPVTLTSNVTGPGAQFAGAVAFLRAGVPIAGCSAVALVDGSAVCSTTALQYGTNSVVAQYGGDGNNLPSTSAALIEQITLDPVGDQDNDGIPNAVEFTESRDPFTKDNEIFTSARWFGMQQYRDFLGREGDATGIQFYTDTLTANPALRGNVIENFFLSPEFSGTVSPVVRLYFAFFLRIPDYPGLIFQTNAFRAGTPLGVIANNFSLSPEFQATYGSLSNSAYVVLLYQNVLGRTASQPEIDFHVNRLTSGVTRGEVMVGFSESPEYQNLQFKSVYVTMMYVGMLRRAPEQSGFDFWVNYMIAGNPGLNLILGFLQAPEYRNRFLP